VAKAPESGLTVVAAAGRWELQDNFKRNSHEDGNTTSNVSPTQKKNTGGKASLEKAESVSREGGNSSNVAARTVATASRAACAVPMRTTSMAPKKGMGNWPNQNHARKRSEGGLESLVASDPKSIMSSSDCKHNNIILGTSEPETEAAEQNTSARRSLCKHAAPARTQRKRHPSFASDSALPRHLQRYLARS
jgi:hypothetical protein